MPYRGYLTSRGLISGRTPQHIQNIVIRNYCGKNNLEYLLSAVEVAMEDCYLMLRQLLNELQNDSGIVFFSMFQLPKDTLERKRIFETILGKSATIHFAAEELYCAAPSDVSRVEDIYSVTRVIDQALSNDELRSVYKNRNELVTQTN